MKSSTKLLFAAALLMPPSAGWSKGLDDLKKMQPAVAVPAAPRTPNPDADVYKDYIGQAGLVSESGNVWKIGNVRWSRGADKKYNWDTALIKPGMVEQVYWGQTLNGFGHAFLVFKLRSGGFKSLRPGAYRSDYLVLSVESKLKRDDVWNPVVGAFGVWNIVWILSTLESFVEDNVRVNGTPTDIYPLLLPASARRKMTDVALRLSVKDRSGEIFNTFTNNCGINALSVVNSALSEEQAVHAVLPSSATEEFIGKHLVGQPVHFTRENSGGGIIAPR